MKLGLLFFAIPLLLFNCEKENFPEEDSYFKTVSISESLNFLKTKNLNAKSTNNIQLSVVLDSAKHETLLNSKEKITVIPATTKYKGIYSRVVLMRINDDIKSVLVNMMPSDSTKLFTGRISITNLNGEFIIGYRVKDGILTTKLIKTQNQSTTRKYQKGTEKLCEYHENGDTSCMFTDTELDEVVITVKSNNLGLDPFGNGGYSPDYEYDYTLDWNFGDGNPNGGGSNDPKSCPTGQSYNVVTGKCEIIKPCIGDPLLNPEIAPQKKGENGIKRGMYGPTRKKWKNGGLVPKFHFGVDLKNSPGFPVYAIFDGKVTAVKKYFQKAGWIAYLSGNVNEKTVTIQYFHLQQENRLDGNVKAGDVIGYQGDSGNLKDAIANGEVDSHVHLKAKENGEDVDPLKFLKTKIDPNNGQIKTPCN